MRCTGCVTQVLKAAMIPCPFRKHAPLMLVVLSASCGCQWQQQMAGWLELSTHSKPGTQLLNIKPSYLLNSDERGLTAAQDAGSAALGSVNWFVRTHAAGNGRKHCDCLHRLRRLQLSAITHVIRP
jgi:hypothetical protein